MNLQALKAVEDLVNKEYGISQEDDDYGYPEITLHDSFGDRDLRGSCEPEDAIWYRDLSDIFYDGVGCGVRNTVKVILDNPEILELFKDKEGEKENVE